MPSELSPWCQVFLDSPLTIERACYSLTLAASWSHKGAQRRRLLRINGKHFSRSVIDIFEPAGWRVADFGTITELSSGTRSEKLERLRLRTYSTFAYFAPDELEVGFRRLEQAVAADPDTPVPDVPATMLILERC